MLIGRVEGEGEADDVGDTTVTLIASERSTGSCPGVSLVAVLKQCARRRIQMNVRSLLDGCKKVRPRYG
jgi:hypothetical protein